MNPSKVPSAEQLRAALSYVPCLRALANTSGVAIVTLYSIARGETVNPGIETVRRFEPYIRQLLEADLVIPKVKPARGRPPKRSPEVSDQT